MKKNASFLINKKAGLQIETTITKAADALQLLNNAQQKLWRQDIYASNLYYQVCNQKFDVTLANEYRHNVVID